MHTPMDEIKYPERPLPCFKCGKELVPVFPGDAPDKVLQAGDACLFKTHGQYGSTMFDETDGSMLFINICDECLVRGTGAGLIWLARQVRYVPDTKVIPWRLASLSPPHPDCPHNCPHLCSIGSICDQENGS